MRQNRVSGMSKIELGSGQKPGLNSTENKQDNSDLSLNKISVMSTVLHTVDQLAIKSVKFTVCAFLSLA